MSEGAHSSLHVRYPVSCTCAVDVDNMHGDDSVWCLETGGLGSGLLTCVVEGLVYLSMSVL